jgi:hypothetical protein
MPIDLVGQLSGGDLRSKGLSEVVASEVRDEQSFDALFAGLSSKSRVVVMRTADAIEKITRTKTSLLAPYKRDILKLAGISVNKELQWHLAQLLPRLDLTKKEADYCRKTLSGWATNRLNSRILRVNSLQSLYDMAKAGKVRRTVFMEIVAKIKKEGIPSIDARLKKLLGPN